MRAASYRHPGPADAVLRLVERPDPTPGPGEIRVRLAFSGINPSDVKARAGSASRLSAFDEVVPHSDGAGIVDAVGPGVSSARIGERVWVYNAQWERADGTAAEYVVLPQAQVVPLPDAVSLEAGASFGIPLLTACHAIDACGPVRERTVLIPGAAGNVGHYAVQLAKLGGARVIGVVSDPHKAQAARAAGADEVIDYRREDLVARVAALTGGRGADCIVEVNAPANAPHYGKLLGFGGKAVIYGSNAASVDVPFGPAILGFFTLHFFIVYRLPDNVFRRHIETLRPWLEAGALRPPAFETYALGSIASAHRRVEAGAPAKVLIQL